MLLKEIEMEKKREIQTVMKLEMRSVYPTEKKRGIQKVIEMGKKREIQTVMNLEMKWATKMARVLGHQ